MLRFAETGMQVQHENGANRQNETILFFFLLFKGFRGQPLRPSESKKRGFQTASKSLRLLKQMSQLLGLGLQITLVFRIFAHMQRHAFGNVDARFAQRTHLVGIIG